MTKTNFIDGSPVTPDFLNALNNPVRVVNPQNDGELFKIKGKFSAWSPDLSFIERDFTKYIGSEAAAETTWGDSYGNFIVPFTGLCHFFFHAAYFVNCEISFRNQNGIDLQIPGQFGGLPPYGNMNQRGPSNDTLPGAREREISGVFPVTAGDNVRIYYKALGTTLSGLLEDLTVQMLFTPEL